MLPDNGPSVSVIVVSYHGGTMLSNCLKALLAQDYPNYEIVAVDNGSGKDLASFSENHDTRIKWVTETDNLGFAGGNNRGILAANGDLIALINDDAVPEAGWLSALVKCAEGNPNAGAIAGLVLDGNSPAQLDSFGVGIALDGMSRQLECRAPAQKERTEKEVLAFSGCSCLLRKKVLEEVGLFDEHFFAYCEDTDLSLRIIRAGCTIVACPDARSLHHYSHTGGRFSLRKLFLIQRNHQWVAAKNFPMRLLLILPLVKLWRLALQIRAATSARSPVRGFMSSGPLRVALVLLKANLAAWVRMPGMLCARSRSPWRRKALTSLLVRNRMPLNEILLPGNQEPPPLSDQSKRQS